MAIHKGYRNKCRRRHRKNIRKKGLGSIEKYLINYEINDKVDIITDPSQQKRGMPHRRFHGLTGTITGVRGRCFEIEVRFGHTMRTLIIGREHLRLNSISTKS
jgi:large subunit ribosomal protein L21e